MRDEGVYDRPHPDDVAFAQARQIVDCGFCDEAGMRGMHKCDHRDYASAAVRGMALIREALEGKAK